jgi:hypothetical protein
MEQTNVRTNFVRRIKRCEKVNAAKDITAFPDNWVAQGDEDANRDYAWWQKCTLVDVPKYQPEWQQVLSALKESLPNAELLKLQRCQIRHLWRSYKNRRELIQLKSGNATTNEKLLWHGTSSTNPTDVLRSEDGLDHRFSAKGFYGTGIYGAEKASYSHSYTYRVGTVDSKPDCRQMLLCKFVLGEHKDYGMQTDNELRLPPLKPGSVEVRYDSVRGGPHSGSTMHIVYSNDRVYPEYLVTYCKGA